MSLKIVVKPIAKSPGAYINRTIDVVFTDSLSNFPCPNNTSIITFESNSTSRDNGINTAQSRDIYLLRKLRSLLMSFFAHISVRCGNMATLIAVENKPSKRCIILTP